MHAFGIRMQMISRIVMFLEEFQKIWRHCESGQLLVILEYSDKMVLCSAMYLWAMSISTQLEMTDILLGSPYPSLPI